MLLADIEIPDWDTLGTCESCGRALSDKPGKVRWGDKPYQVGDCGRRRFHRCGVRHGGAVQTCDLTRRDCQMLTQDEKLQASGVKPDKLPMRAPEVMKAIREKHRNRPNRVPEWLILSEVDLGGRRADALALRLYTNRGFELHAYEVKVDRSDLVNELKTPAKREPAMECSTHFWFATPIGLMKPEEVPDECGLIEFGRSKGTRRPFQSQVVVHAPKRTIKCLTTRLVHVMAWRLRDIEHSLQGRGIVL